MGDVGDLIKAENEKYIKILISNGFGFELYLKYLENERIRLKFKVIFIDVKEVEL